MPTLKNITCCVEWSGSDLPLQEYQTTFADGYVETYIAVPSTPSPFSVHLRSDGYIAPGLAMFVYMDGVYHCNRNRHNLVEPGAHTRRRQTEVDFRVRQKEERLEDGTFMGKQWMFEKVNIVPGSSVEDSHRAPHDGEYVGSIEVVVLRCFGDGAIKPSRNLLTSNLDGSNDDDIPVLTGGVFDGACDRKKRPIGLDGSSDSPPPTRIRRQAPRREGSVNSIHNSTVNIYSDSQRDRKSGSPSSTTFSGARKKANRNAPLNYYRSDWGSIGYGTGSEILRSQGPHQPNSPILQLRGGAPGSYTVSPLTSGPGAQAVENQNWQPDPNEWNPPPVPEWDPVAQAEKRDAWGELPDEPTSNIGVAAGSSWNAPQEAVPETWNQGEISGWANTTQDANQGVAEGTAADNANGWGTNQDWNDGNDDGDNNDNGDTAAWDSTGDNQGNQQQGNNGWDNENGNEPVNADQSNGWNTGAAENGKSDKAWSAKSNGNNVRQNDGTSGKSAGLQSKKQSNMFTFGNSLAGSSKAKSTGKARSAVTAAASSLPKSPRPLGMQWVSSGNGNNAEELKEPLIPKHKTTSIPGQWSPPLKSNKTPPKKAEHPNLPQAVPNMSIPTMPKSKTYWSSWKEPDRPSATMKIGGTAKVPSARTPVREPIYSVPAETAQRTNMSHQVHPMRAAAYTHKLSTPRYMDTHEDPYAVFVFKYRDKALIENMVKASIPDPGLGPKEKSDLFNLSKAELVDELVRTKEKLSAAESSESDKISFKSHPVGQNWGLPDLNAVGDKLKDLGTGGGKDGVDAWVQNTPKSATDAIKAASTWGANPLGGGAWGGSNNSNKASSAKGSVSNKSAQNAVAASNWGNDQTNDDQGQNQDGDDNKDNANGNWGDNNDINGDDNQGNGGWGNNDANAEDNNNNWSGDNGGDNGGDAGGDGGDNGGNNGGGWGADDSNGQDNAQNDDSAQTGWGANANGGGGGNDNGTSWEWNNDTNGGDTTGGANAGGSGGW